MKVEIKERIEMINKGEVPEGYKKTKVGIIPEDWEETRLDKVSKITMGQSPSSANYNENGIGLPLIQGNADIKDRYTSPRLFTSEITKTCEVDDIIMSVRAPVGEIAKSVHKACIGRGVCSIRPVENNYYLYHYLINNEKLWTRYSQGSTFESVNSSDIKKFRVISPKSKKEQQKIAQILSTWDEAIGLKEKLIEEKKEQKKGLMQKLLTGEVRLAGFDGEWEEVRLGSLCNITTGKLDANAMCVDGKYKFFTCAKEIYLIDEYAFDTEALLISGNGANVGYIHYYNGKFNAYQRTYVLDNFKNSIHYTKYVLDKYLEEQIAREKCAGNTPYIRMSTLSDMNIKIPKSLQEQKAIAKILSTADKEIDLLTQELEQLKLQKKGLMQLLLTGIIRVKS